MGKELYLGKTATFSKTLTETDVYNFAGICENYNLVYMNRIETQKWEL